MDAFPSIRATATGSTWPRRRPRAGAGRRRRCATRRRKAGKSEVLDRYAADYPQGPARPAAIDVPGVRIAARRPADAAHRDRPVGLGLLRLRADLHLAFLRRQAQRRLRAVQFSETLVTGKLFEDIKEAVEGLADPALYDTIIVTNLCVPTASGVPLQLLPDEINGVRVIGIDVPGFGVPTHAEAKDVLAGAMLSYARKEAEAGPVAAPKQRTDRPTVTLLGEMFPADPPGIGLMLEPLGLAAGPVVPTREWRELYQALDCAVVGAIHPFYTASIREFEGAGRPIIGSAPVGADGTAAWLDAIGAACGIAQDKVDVAKNRFIPAIRAALAAKPINGRITVSGYEGSELLVARLLIESGADVPYVGTACPRTKWSDPDREWLEAHGARVQYRASLEQDIAAVEEFGPDLAIGTTPVVQHAKAKAIPALYFTNLISARPLMGPAGAGSLAMVDQRRARQPASLRQDDRLLRGRRQGCDRRRMGKPRRSTAPNIKAKFAAKRIAAAKAEESIGS